MVISGTWCFTEMAARCTHSDALNKSPSLSSAEEWCEPLAIPSICPNIGFTTWTLRYIIAYINMRCTLNILFRFDYTWVIPYLPLTSAVFTKYCAHGAPIHLSWATPQSSSSFLKSVGLTGNFALLFGNSVSHAYDWGKSSPFSFFLFSASGSFTSSRHLRVLVVNGQCLRRC